MKTKWTTYTKLTGIDQEGECLSCLTTTSGQRSIVRPTTGGEYAVLALQGSLAKVLKVLPTLDRARAYNFALARLS